MVLLHPEPYPWSQGWGLGSQFGSEMEHHLVIILAHNGLIFKKCFLGLSYTGVQVAHCTRVLHHSGRIHIVYLIHWYIMAVFTQMAVNLFTKIIGIL